MCFNFLGVKHRADFKETYRYFALDVSLFTSRKKEYGVNILQSKMKIIPLQRQCTFVRVCITTLCYSILSPVLCSSPL